MQVDVADALASYQDPIKAILGVGVHKDQRILIKRKYVVGGQATITPERAPARTVAIQEDVREVMLTRYGGDLEMNLNLFLRPGDAQAELALKLNAQKRELEHALTDIGYEMLMREGTQLADAIIRSNPTYQGYQDPQAIEAATRIMSTQVFGAMAKHAYPITNLLAAARYASVYNTTGDTGSVLLLPHGCPELLKYTNKEQMNYAVSGLKISEVDKINIPLQNVYRDPTTNVSAARKPQIHITCNNK